MTELFQDDEMDMIHIKWSDNSDNSYPFLWLRENDPAGFHKDTNERMTDLTSIPLDISLTKAFIKDDVLILNWSDSENSTRYNLDWLYHHKPGKRASDPAAIKKRCWRGGMGRDKLPTAKAKDLLQDDDALATWLENTQSFGLSLVSGLEARHDAGMEVAKRIGFLRETNFGTTFQVQSKPNPNNLAYTSVALPPHTDLPNQELPPGFQFLHCLANEAEGGGSTFADGLAIATDLRANDIEAFNMLSSVSIPFRFYDENTDIRSRKHVITLNLDGEISEICFNAHIAEFLDIDPKLMKSYYRAYGKFMKMTRSNAYLISLRLAVGEMVVFDNRRILHGRDAFNPETGFRHLHGCYVDRGEFESRLRVLKRRSGDA
jgi:gamma-butyrobetaine dioxygenase